MNKLKVSFPLSSLLAMAIAAAFFPSSTLHAQAMLSAQGGRCMDSAGGIFDGAPIIAWDCHAGDNQKFQLQDGRLRLGYSDYCAAVDSRNQGAPLVLRRCDWSANGNALQNIARWNNWHIGHNTGYCLDLAGGLGGAWWARLSGGVQPVVLWSCHGGDNQKWLEGTFRSGVDYDWVVRNEGLIFAVPGYKGLMQARGGQIVAAGGGNIVAAGGGNIVAAGGGNIVAAGGGNVQVSHPPY